jgi:hypothetical protein
MGVSAIHILIVSLTASVVWVPTVASRVRQSQVLPKASAASCANLANNGSFYIVDVAVGTPTKGHDLQTFSLVADTGSNHIIVASCDGSNGGACHHGEKGFVGTNRSSSFLVQDVSAERRSVAVTFGSGTIKAIVASDVVRIGQVSAMADDSLFLMYDRDLAFPLEGVLGLGIPQNNSFALVKSNKVKPMSADMKLIKQLMEELHGEIGGKRVHRKDLVTLEMQAQAETNKNNPWQPKSFLELAGITRFSMCFNKDSDGVLRFNTPPLKAPLKSIGVRHWSLDFRGIRIGNAAEPIVCSIDDMPSTQNTPCAIIPDSGTTNILGPKRQVNSVLASICDGWARCRSKLTAMEKASEKAVTKRDALEELLADCESWLTEGEGLRELPSVNFVMADVGTEKAQTIELAGWSYVTQINISESQRKELQRPGMVLPKMMCDHAFGQLEYKTPKHGPVWVLGMPLFFTHRVDFEMSPLSISLTSLNEEPCGSCGKGVSLLSYASRTRRNFQTHPRRVWGEPRRLVLDVNKPL